MAFYYEEPSRTFSEYLLIPGYSSTHCIPSQVNLKNPSGQIQKRGRAGTVHQRSYGFCHHAVCIG